MGLPKVREREREGGREASVKIVQSIKKRTGLPKKRERGRDGERRVRRLVRVLKREQDCPRIHVEFVVINGGCGENVQIFEY